MTPPSSTTAGAPAGSCRHCGAPLSDRFLYLGHQPPSNAYLKADDLKRPEITYPLDVWLCRKCLLVQVPKHADADALFTPDYAYFSSVSAGWVEHSRRYAEAIIPRLGLGPDSLVVELASNDGYLLQFFARHGIPCLGIEPTASTAAAARGKGIETIEEFFGADLARKLVKSRGHADLVIGNNVLAHVPDINDFVAGIATLLAPEGTATLEFPHLKRLVEGRQFDTIYHEHYSYLSLLAVTRIFARADLVIADVDELPTHGGSLRIHARHRAATPVPGPAVERLLAEERAAGMEDPAWYGALQEQAEEIADDLLAFLIDCRRKGHRVAAYGAAAKGNTLLNFAGVRPHLLPFVCDAAPSKQGRFLPGSHIPVLPPEALREHRPDHVLILPWNIREEIMDSLSDLREGGTRFVTAIPRLEVT